MSLLDRALPHYDVNEIHAIDIHAPPERVYRALQDYRLSDSPVSRALFTLRALPARLMRRIPPRAGPEPPLVEMLDRGGFVKISERPNEEIVVGLIGKFWQLSPEQVRLENAEAFLRFEDPAYAKSAMNFRLELRGNGITHLSTETRVHVADPASRRRFRLYWAVIGFFSGWIRIEMLRGIKRIAEVGR